MAYLPHTLVTFGGKQIGGGAWEERWQCGVRCVQDTGSGQVDDPDAFLASFGPALKTFWTTAGNGAPTTFTLEWAKCNGIEPDGTYAYPISHTVAIAGNPAGPGTTFVPGVLCLALSWTTARTFGIGHTGRIYWPTAFGSGQANTTVSPGTAAAYAAVGKGLLTLIKAQTQSGGKHLIPVVASRGSHTGRDAKGNYVYGGTGLNEPITGVRVGTVIDMVRRRKRQITEAYSTVTFP